ncbi:4Fe-4S ferredoxin iron-sulfur binding domain protein [Elusimicrobium minutum Pei191]|uniref:4Fe-4S ferredoxin iron-sulfur binding domain protein n=1 Tax=Elusimicrobium minutum (strain Pei191) TaxID=445932 RepID=B2KBK7_ELUMP|nr:EFR1 family ferrodoxin [Elusimicrobium minutum]ACC98029.1 4Fe-4S ferredoxin iron-sulfur binding domain protein [Elusimicrobium minutum Pei191]
MKTIVYCFSGTGNSVYAAAKTAKALLSEVKFITHELKTDGFVCNAERVVFSFPVYYWGPPVKVLEFIKKLQMPNARYISVLANAGSSYGAVFGITAKLLEEKGKNLDYAVGIKMPSNYIPFISVKSAEKSAKKLEKADKDIDAYIDNVKNGFTNGPFTINKLAKKVFDFSHAKTANKDKKFFVNPGCTKCGVCAAVCPADNIIINDNGPEWRHKCLQCMACINYCPEKVIQIRFAFSKYQDRYRHPLISAAEISKQK